MDYRELIQNVWPDWQVKEILGQGSYGTVFKAVKEKYGVIKESAIKLVHIPTDDNQLEQLRQSFQLSDNELKDYFYPEVVKLMEEVALMEKLGENEHCIHIQDFDVIEDPNGNVGWNLLIRMELLDSLESRIIRDGMNLGEMISLGEDILSALENCEIHRIIHRDIKPANIFVNSNGTYKLGDFGIAKNLALGSRNLSHRGTDNYAAPELCLGKEYSYNIDIYSLGLVMYQLLNKNKRPFFGDGKITSILSEEAYRKRLTGEIFPPPAFGDDELFALISKMCAFDPKERFQKAIEAKKALQIYREQHEEKMDTILELGKPVNSKIQSEKESSHIDESFSQGHVKYPSKVEQKLGECSSDTVHGDSVYEKKNIDNEINDFEGYTRSLYYTEELGKKGKDAKSRGDGLNTESRYIDIQDCLRDAKSLKKRNKNNSQEDITVGFLFTLIAIIILVCIILFWLDAMALW